MTYRALLFLLILGWASWSAAQVTPSPDSRISPSSSAAPPARAQDDTVKDWNQRIAAVAQDGGSAIQDYRIGPDDLVDITVFQAPEMSGTARVSASGDVSLPLLGVIKAAGLTPRGLEMLLQEALRQSYVKDPHVGVFVREMHSHPVSVFGAVNRPGIFQVSGPKSLLELLAMAEGLSQDAGDTVLIMKNSHSDQKAETSSEPESETETEWQSAGSPVSRGEEDGTIKVNLKDLMESGDPRYNVLVYPQDAVTVARAGVVYVIGDVNRPGGFMLKTNENISVLQAVALAEGLMSTAKKSATRIIRTDKATGQRTEIALDLGKVLEGKESDRILQPNDVLFVPNSAARTVMSRGAQAAVSTVSGLIIWRR
ncbi:MAG: polysaccharide biosynthesis/export family protein [Acidobacteria bacterium]|nr:polysaccharide biosynthesis/export family protein [Acidobacteriota bacterium]